MKTFFEMITVDINKKKLNFANADPYKPLFLIIDNGMYQYRILNDLRR